MAAPTSSQQVSPQEALIFTMVTMSAVDRNMTDAELARIGALVGQLPVFAGFNPDDLVPLAQRCGEIIASETGLSDVLAVIRTSLPPSLYETGYALGVEIAAADLNVKIEELRLLELLRDELDLDKLTTAAIERGARARHATG
ncbi:MAG: tellurite resistance TerB family protein [Pseudomonadota bacterium]